MSYEVGERVMVLRGPGNEVTVGFPTTRLPRLGTLVEVDEHVEWYEDGIDQHGEVIWRRGKRFVYRARVDEGPELLCLTADWNFRGLDLVERLGDLAHGT